MKNLAFFIALTVPLAASGARAHDGTHPGEATEIAVDTKSIDEFINGSGSVSADDTANT